MLTSSKTNLDRLPPIRVLAFEAELDYRFSRRGRGAPPVCITRSEDGEGSSLRIEVGGWNRPQMVGVVTYQEIQAAPSWHLLAGQVSLCLPSDVWWRVPDPPGQAQGQAGCRRP